MTSPAPRDTVARETETLLAEAAFVRRLAGALLRDQSLADDVSQDVLTTALQQPQPPRNWRHWLGAVTRRLAFKTRRANQLRARHESNAAGDQAGDPEGEALQRLQMHRELTEAVLSLAEPYRSVVTMRFLEGLTPRVIAQRTNTTSELTRQRVRRGLVMLRERLDQQHGSRQAWCAALTGLGFGAASLPMLTLSILAMNKLAVAGCAILAAIAIIVSSDWTTQPAAPTNDVIAATQPDVGSTSSEPLESSTRNDATPAAASTACVVHLKNTSGRAIAGATIACWQADGSFTEAQTDEAGVASFNASGSGGLLALASQLTPTSRTISELTGKHELLMLEGESVGGIALVDGQPAPAGIELAPFIRGAHTLPNVPEGLQDRLQWTAPETVTTQVGGAFRLRGLPASWQGSLVLPNHLWLLPESGGSNDVLRQFTLEPGRNDHLIQCTQLPSITGHVVWDDNGEPVEHPLVNVHAEFSDGGQSPVTGAKAQGNRFLAAVMPSRSGRYFQWVDPKKRPTVLKFKIWVGAEGVDEETELELDAEQFRTGTIVVRIKRPRTNYFVAVAEDDTAIPGARILTRRTVSDPTGVGGRGTFTGATDDVKAIGAPGFRIGPTDPIRGSGKLNDPLVFRLVPENVVTIHLLDPSDRLPNVTRLELKAKTLMFAGNRMVTKLDRTINPGTSNQTTSSRRGQLQSHSLTLPLPDQRTSVHVRSMEPGCAARVTLTDRFDNEAAAQNFVAPAFGQSISVTLRVEDLPTSIQGLVQDEQLRPIANARIRVEQLREETPSQGLDIRMSTAVRTITNTEGRFDITPVYARSNYSIAVKAAGYARLVRNITAKELGDVIPLRMQPGHRVTVKVVDTTGAMQPWIVRVAAKDVTSQVLSDGRTQFDDLPLDELEFFTRIGTTKFAVVHDTTKPTVTLRVPTAAKLAIAMAEGTWPQPSTEDAYLMATVTRLDASEKPSSVWRPNREGIQPAVLLPGRYRVELVEQISGGDAHPLGLTAEVTLKAGELTTAKLR